MRGTVHAAPKGQPLFGPALALVLALVSRLLRPLRRACRGQASQPPPLGLPVRHCSTLSPLHTLPLEVPPPLPLAGLRTGVLWGWADEAQVVGMALPVPALGGQPGAGLPAGCRRSWRRGCARRSRWW